MNSTIRVLGVAALLFGWCGVFGSPACSQTYSCVGDFTSTCTDLDASSCTKARGCHKVKAACVNKCDVPDSDCPRDSCNVLNGACSSACDATTDESSCNGLTVSLGNALSLHQCEWDDGACKSPCAALDDEASCQEQTLAGCVWIACEGAPKDDCSSYSGDDCPTFLGCDRTAYPVQSTH